MVAFVDHYRVLGVAPSADPAQIRRAYRQAVHRYHADRRPDDAAASEQMRTIVAAREVLCDPERRARFDLARTRHQRPGVVTDPPGDPLFQAAARAWGEAPPPAPPAPPPAHAMGWVAAMVVGATGLAAALGLSLVAAAGLTRPMRTPPGR